jgi:hypothetical protein
MYLALALKQFVLNVTDYLKTQWTWKKCLKFAIEAMNDVGVEYYSNFETQRLWHRKFARNRYFYCKTQEPKTSYPAFFVENPDAMEAFKKYGIAHIKDLRVKMMLEYVHQELMPKLMLKREASLGLFDDNGDDAADVVGVSADKTVPAASYYQGIVFTIVWPFNDKHSNHDKVDARLWFPLQKARKALFCRRSRTTGNDSVPSCFHKEVPCLRSTCPSMDTSNTGRVECSCIK